MDAFINHLVRKQYLFVDLNTYFLTDNTGYLVIDWIRFEKKASFFLMENHIFVYFCGYWQNGNGSEIVSTV